MSSWDRIAGSLLSKGTGNSPYQAFQQGRRNAIQEEELARREVEREKLAQFGGLVGSELLKEAPNEALIASQMASVDPMGALKFGGYGAQAMGRETDTQRKLQDIKLNAPLKTKITKLSNDIMKKVEDPDYDLTNDFTELKMLESDYFNATGILPRTDPFEVTEFRSKREAGKRAVRKEAFEKEKFYTQIQEGREKEERGIERDERKMADKKMPVYASFHRLRENPADITARSNALNRLLRNESGAAIGKDEVVSRLKTVLPKSEHKNIMRDLGGLEGWLANTFGKENIQMLNVMDRYLPKMSTDEMLRVLKAEVGTSYDYLEKTYDPSIGKSTAEKESKPTKRKVVSEDDFFGGL